MDGNKDKWWKERKKRRMDRKRMVGKKQLEKVGREE